MYIDEIKNKGELRTYNEISSVGVGRKIQVTEGVFAERLPNQRNNTIYRIEMLKGSICPTQFHDCIKELVLYTGELYESESKLKITKLRTIKIPKNKLHTIIALEDSIFYSHLYKIY